MQQPDNVKIPLIDSTLRTLTFECGERAALSELTVSIPTLAQLLAVIKLEPKDGAEESPWDSVRRSFEGAIIFCTPAEPERWTLRWFLWLLQRRRVVRTVRSLSYPQLMTMLRNMEAWALGMSAEGMASINRQPTPEELRRDSAMEALCAMVELIAAETGMPVGKVWDMPGPEQAAQLKAVFAKLQRQRVQASAATGGKGVEPGVD